MKKILLPLIGIAIYSSGCASAPVSEDVSHADQDRVEAEMYKRRDQFKACYDNASVHKTGLVSTKFKIEPNGKATHVVVDMSTLGQPEVESCLLKGISEISFPAPADGATADVQYPFKFTPGK